jgi:hypothetical protein
MRHICTVVTIWTAVSLGVGMAQQDIPTDTSNTLAAEWKTPTSTLNCLRALGIYATYTLPGSLAPLSPADAVTAALNELLLGVPAAVTDLYTVAQQRADFLDKLANANTLNPTAAQEDALFATAAARIQTIYASTPNGKRNLATVQASSAQKKYNLAIFQLLSAYPQSNPVDQPYADSLEILRACYKKNTDRLFKLVSDKILGAN